MTTTRLSIPPILDNYAETIRELCRRDRAMQAARSKRAAVVGILLTVLGSAALMGCGQMLTAVHG